MHSNHHLSQDNPSPGLNIQAALHDSAAPTSTSVVQASPSSQLKDNHHHRKSHRPRWHCFHTTQSNRYPNLHHSPAHNSRLRWRKRRSQQTAHCASQVSELPVQYRFGASTRSFTGKWTISVAELASFQHAIAANRRTVGIAICITARGAAAIIADADINRFQRAAKVARLARPERTASSHELVGSGQTGEQSPSQVSSPSTTPLPQLASAIAVIQAVTARRTTAIGL